ncbi:MAG: Holliday junction branch migration protein RuvA [bacterium]|nr:Holliday junction branch migration protein RuvA [bacterium]
MISYLKGNIIKKTNKGVILNTGQVGYFVYMTAPSLEEIKENQDTEYYIHTNVREDALDLYGFKKYEDLLFFKNLISISGVGPRLALDILSVPPAKVKAAILNEDIAYLKEIPGIGPKSAKRIILELKGKIEDEGIDETYQKLSPINAEVLDALMRLGYQRNQVSQTLKDIPKEITETEEIITYFLKNA